MIDAAEPHMIKTVRLFEVAEDAKGASQEAALEALRDVLEDIRALTGHSDQGDLLSLLSGVPSGSAAANTGPSSAREEIGAAPPSSNTGVRTSGPSSSNAVDRG